MTKISSILTYDYTVLCYALDFGAFDAKLGIKNNVIEQIFMYTVVE